jgi:hypothetical protein
LGKEAGFKELKMDLEPLVGTWINSNPDTNSVAVVKATGANGQLTLHVSAVGPEGFMDWGSADAHVFAASPESKIGAGFTCRYVFDYGETRFQAMIMKGLLVLAQFHLFNDERENFFLREYFAATHDRFLKG